MFIIMIKMLWEVGASSIITTTSSIENGGSLQTCCSLHSLLSHSSTKPEAAAIALPAKVILELPVVIEVLLIIATIIIILILGAISNSSKTSNSNTNNIIGNMAVLFNLLQDGIEVDTVVSHHFHLESQTFTDAGETELKMFNLLEHNTKCYYAVPNPISLIKLKGQESQSVCFIETDKSIS